MPEEWKLYVEYRDGEPIAYRYGPSWVSQQLMMEGGYPTPEEAKDAWYKYVANNMHDVVNKELTALTEIIKQKTLAMVYSTEFLSTKDYVECIDKILQERML